MPYKGGNDPDSGYLVLDEFEKQLIQKLREANILRQPPSSFDQVPEDIHTAVLYCLAYLYEYRETADFDAMVKFLRAILTPYRKEAF
ncbi:head-tail connector protein [Ligilactobacillus agilis]|uniref:head-tail connector protein n=1 Tax=Ligilactobacillus agilis TaxID=1601 RepID=UPI00255D12FA|nr:head-tail connector protein [Ligilactobacillus agilis]